jgi:hypothetical protein
MESSIIASYSREALRMEIAGYPKGTRAAATAPRTFNLLKEEER